MKAFEFVAEVDAAGRIQVALPASVMPGPVRVIILAQEAKEDEVDALWMQGIAHEWADELTDVNQDIYTLEDGEPVDAAR